MRSIVSHVNLFWVKDHQKLSDSGHSLLSIPLSLDHQSSYLQTKLGGPPVAMLHMLAMSGRHPQLYLSSPRGRTSSCGCAIWRIPRYILPVEARCRAAPIHQTKTPIGTTPIKTRRILTANTVPNVHN